MKVEGVTGGAFVPAYNDNALRQNTVDGTVQFPEDSITVHEDVEYFDPNNKAHVQKVEESVKQLNKTMETYHTELRFQLHEGSGEYFVKVINPSDGTVVREIPPEKVLNMVAYFKELMGIIVDKFI